MTGHERTSAVKFPVASWREHWEPSGRDQAARMSERWRELATLVGVSPLSEADRSASPACIVTENGEAFDVAEVLLAFAQAEQTTKGRRIPDDLA